MCVRVFALSRLTSSLTCCHQLMGLAVYNSIALDIHFPLYVYRWVGSAVGGVTVV